MVRVGHGEPGNADNFYISVKQISASVKFYCQYLVGSNSVITRGLVEKHCRWVFIQNFIKVSIQITNNPILFVKF